MPLAVTTRLLETHDVLLLLVPLMEKAPWVRKNRNNGAIEKFEDHQWERVEADDEGRLPKLQTQVWLAIYNLVMDQECRSRYELTSFRKENLLRLRRYINEVVVDQLPPLTNLHRTLEEMSISGQFTGASPAQVAPFVVEMVAEAREMLARSYEGRWQEIADLQLREVLVKETPEELKRLGNMIAIPKDMFDEPPNGSEPPPEREALAWDMVSSMPSVLSTASFFAAAREPDSPSDEVLILSAAPQKPPNFGGRLRLELRRTQYSQLGVTSVRERAGGDSLVAKRATEPDVFLLAVDAPGVSATAMKVQNMVSAKGAAKTGQQLRDMLEKPGREGLKAMYVEDVAEFAVMIGNEEGELRLTYVPGLSCAA